MLMQIGILTAIVLAALACIKALGWDWFKQVVLGWLPVVLALAFIANADAGKTADGIALVTGFLATAGIFLWHYMNGTTK